MERTRKSIMLQGPLFNHARGHTQQIPKTRAQFLQIYFEQKRQVSPFLRAQKSAHENPSPWSAVSGYFPRRLIEAYAMLRRSKTRTSELIPAPRGEFQLLDTQKLRTMQHFVVKTSEWSICPLLTFPCLEQRFKIWIFLGAWESYTLTVRVSSSDFSFHRAIVVFAQESVSIAHTKMSALPDNDAAKLSLAPNLPIPPTRSLEAMIGVSAQREVTGVPQ